MELYNYESPFYNEVIYALEKEWNRRLNEHERNVLIYGYRFGRKIEAENEIKILETLR